MDRNICGFKLSSGCPLWAVLLLLVVNTALGDMCVSGSCNGTDASCLANVKETCNMAPSGGCQTEILKNGTVIASCVAACPTTTVATTTPTTAGTSTLPTSTTPTTATTATTTPTTTPASGRKRRATTDTLQCCETNMCNAPSQSSAIRFDLSLLMLAGVFFLVAEYCNHLMF